MLDVQGSQVCRVIGSHEGYVCAPVYCLEGDIEAAKEVLEGHIEALAARRMTLN